MSQTLTPKPKTKRIKRELTVIGWIEHIDLPDLTLLDVRTKIDTGARTSALHATQIAPFTKDGEDWVRFHVQIDDTQPGLDLETPIYDMRQIKNTGGVPEERIVIRTRFRLGGETWPISVSLTDRANMRFPMIVGRSALKRRNIAVHSRKAHLVSSKERT